MKTITLIQRLRTGFGVLCVVALVVGAGVAWQAWGSVQRQFAAEQLRGRAAAATERMRFATLQMGEALLGALLDPQSQVERRKKSKADEELSRVISELRPLLRDQRDAYRALEAISDQDAAELNMIEDKVLALAATDPAAARRDYAEKYLPARRKQEQLLNDFANVTARLGPAELDWHPIAFYAALAACGLVAVGAFLARRTEVAFTNSLQALWQGEYEIDGKI